MALWESFWKRSQEDVLRAGSTLGFWLECLVNGNAFTEMIKEGIFFFFFLVGVGNQWFCFSQVKLNC